MVCGLCNLKQIAEDAFHHIFPYRVTMLLPLPTGDYHGFWDLQEPPGCYSRCISLIRQFVRYFLCTLQQLPKAIKRPPWPRNRLCLWQRLWRCSLDWFGEVRCLSKLLTLSLPPTLCLVIKLPITSVHFFEFR